MKKHTDSVAKPELEKPRIASFDQETGKIDFGGELYYHNVAEEIIEKAGLKEPLLKHFIGHDMGGAAFYSGIQLNAAPLPGMGYDHKDMDAYVADQSVIHRVLEIVNAENALRPGKRAAQEEARRVQNGPKER